MILLDFRWLGVPSQQAPAAPDSLGDRLLAERSPLSSSPESSFGSQIKKSTKAEHQSKQIFPFMAFLESPEPSPGRQSRAEKKAVQTFICHTWCTF